LSRCAEAHPTGRGVLRNAAGWKACTTKCARSSVGAAMSGYGPGVGAGDEGLEVARTALGDGFVDLVADQLAIAAAGNVAEDSHRFGKLRIAHAAEEEGETWLMGLLIMDQEVILLHILEADGFRIKGVEADPLIAVLAEDQRLAVLEVKRGVGFGFLVR